MEVSSDLQWEVFGQSVKGATHTKLNLPNQDAIGCKKISATCAILAVADGHGSLHCIRSDIGAKKAVEIAIKEIENFLLETEELKNDLSIIKKDAEIRLVKRLVHTWRNAVKDDFSQNPFKEEDLKKLKIKSTPISEEEQINLYGTTLLSTVVTDTYILYIQLGDGDILTVSNRGDVARPLSEDKRNIANETTSLCIKDAWQDFRIALQAVTPFHHKIPSLILLSTDGYSNSFLNEEEFRKVGCDLLHMIQDSGLDNVKEHLGSWLSNTTKEGSGDDITVGLFYHSSILENMQVTDNNDNVQMRSQFKSPYPQPRIKGQENETTGKSQTIEFESIKDPSNQGIVILPVLSHLTAPNISDQQTIGTSGSSLHVSKNESASISTIRDAIEQAPSGSHIIVHPGIYNETIVLDKPVHIRGEGPRDKIIIKVVDGPCIKMKTTMATVSNLTLNSAAEISSAIDIGQGNLELTGCTVDFETANGIEISGENTKATVLSCSLYRGKGYGIHISNNGNGIIRNCQIVENEKAGIFVSSKGIATIEDCQIYDGKAQGVHINQNSSAIIKDCNIHNNTEAGVEIDGCNDVNIQHCAIHHGKTKGIYIHDQSSVRVSGQCRIFENVDNQVVIQQKSQLVMENSAVCNGKAIGVQLFLHSQAKIIDCEVKNNTLLGIDILSASEATIINGCIVDNKEKDLLVHEKSHAELIDVQIEPIKINRDKDSVLKN